MSLSSLRSRSLVLVENHPPSETNLSCTGVDMVECEAWCDCTVSGRDVQGVITGARDPEGL